MSTMKNFIKPSRGNSSSELEMAPTSAPEILRRVGDAELQEAQFLSIPRDESLHSNIAVTEAVRAGMGSWIVVSVLVLDPDQPTKMAPAFGRAVRVGGKS
jgi:hypothetical protein